MADETTTADEKDEKDEQPLIPAHVADPNARDAPFPGFAASAAAHPQATLVPAAAPNVGAPTSQAPLIPMTPAPSPAQPFNPAAPITHEQAEEQVNPWAALNAKGKATGGVKGFFERLGAGAGAGAEGLSKNYPAIATERENAAERLQQQPLQWVAEEAKEQPKPLTPQEEAAEAELQARKTLEDPNATDAQRKQIYAAYPDLDPANQKSATPHEPVKPVIGSVNGKPAFGVYTEGKGWTDAEGKPLTDFEPPAQKPAPEKAVTLQLPNGQKIAGKTDDQGNLLTADGKPAPAGSTLYQAPAYATVIGGNQAKQDIATYTDKYNEAAAARQELGDIIQQGQQADPNQVANSIAQMAGGLMVTTAAGVHRINTTEMEAWGGKQGLSWANEVNKWLDKGTRGAVPENIAQDWQKLVDIYAKRSYAAYLSTVRTAGANQGLRPDEIMVSNEEGNDTIPLSEAVKQAGANRSKTFEVPKGAPAAKGLADGSKLKDAKGNVIAVAEGGQWQAPTQ